MKYCLAFEDVCRYLETIPKPPLSCEVFPTQAMGETGDTENTGYTLGDSDSIRLRNTWKWLTGGLTEEGRRQYRRDRDLRYAQEDCRRCQKERDYLLQYSIETCSLGMA